MNLTPEQEDKLGEHARRLFSIKNKAWVTVSKRFAMCATPSGYTNMKPVERTSGGEAIVGDIICFSDQWRRGCRYRYKLGRRGSDGVYI